MKEYLYTHYLEAIRSVLENSPKIDRKFMPQVHHDDLSDAVRLLSKKGIRCKFTEVFPYQLKSSQKQVNREKVKNICKDILRGKEMPHIVISNDNYIVDGHHRWIAYKLLDPGDTIKVMIINLPKNEAIKIFKEIEGSLK